MDVIASALETSYLRESAEESAAWEALRGARDRLVEQAIAAGVSAGAARKRSPTVAFLPTPADVTLHGGADRAIFIL